MESAVARSHSMSLRSSTRFGKSLKQLSHLLVVAAVFITTVSSSSSPSTTTGFSLDNLRAIFSSAVLSSTPSVSPTKNGTTFGDLTSVMGSHPSSHSTSSGVSGRCLNNASVTLSNAADCVISLGKCVSIEEVGSLYSLESGSTLTQAETDALTPALLYHLISCGDIRQEDEHSGKPSSQASWGYSFLFVTVINLCSMTGALVLPCMRFKSYKTVLMFLVALAVGTLAGSGLLFLIPEALELGEHGNDYIWKSTTIMGGIYLFYLLEKLLRAINDKRENTRQKKRQDELATQGQFTSSFTRKPIDNSIPEKDINSIVENMCGEGMCSVGGNQTAMYKNVIASPSNNTINGDLGIGDSSAPQMGGNSLATTPEDPGKRPCNGSNHVSSHGSEHQRVAPVAYMIIFGDALHNFIDGLSIGSAFTKSTMTGISVSVAVMCEELPHELGDFAILLNSGMRIRKALCYNFLSACTCYVGTAIGILLGENTQSHGWIFALAGGMFLYISLVDMLPEMNAAAESPEGKVLGGMKVFIIHNIGLLTGFGIMLVFAVFGDNISFE